MKQVKIVSIFFDGAVTFNPGGFSSCGVCVYNDDSNRICYKITKEIEDNSTNNVAEWFGLLSSLNIAYDLIKKDKYKNSEIKIFGDSQLVINGINGKWRVKSERLIPIYKDSVEILRNISLKNKIDIIWIPRDLNKADKYSRLKDKVYIDYSKLK